MLAQLVGLSFGKRISAAPSSGRGSGKRRDQRKNKYCHKRKHPCHGCIPHFHFWANIIFSSSLRTCSIFSTASFTAGLSSKASVWPTSLSLREVLRRVRSVSFNFLWVRLAASSAFWL